MELRHRNARHILLNNMHRLYGDMFELSFWRGGRRDVAPKPRNELIALYIALRLNHVPRNVHIPVVTVCLSWWQFSARAW
jgi:hypothetical protein